MNHTGQGLDHPHYNGIKNINANTSKTNITDVVAKYIAREMLLFDEGTRIPTVDEYEERFHVSRGTVQKALTVIDEHRVVDLRKRGVLGTFLHGKDMPRLWELTGWTNLTGVGALPHTRKQEALSSAIYMAFENAKAPFNLAYLQGAFTRVKGMLVNKYDFVVSSKGSAEFLVQEMPAKLEIVLEMQPYSYLTGYCIIKRKNYPSEMIKKIGIDPNSPEQARLTRRLFPSAPTDIIEMHYTRMPTAVSNGDIDACIFNRDAAEGYFQASLEIEDIPANLDFSDFTRAVIITSSENYMIDELIKKIVNPKQVATMQEQVMTGRRLPIL